MIQLWLGSVGMGGIHGTYHITVHDPIEWFSSPKKKQGIGLCGAQLNMLWDYAGNLEDGQPRTDYKTFLRDGRSVCLDCVDLLPWAMQP